MSTEVEGPMATRQRTARPPGRSRREAFVASLQERYAQEEGAASSVRTAQHNAELNTLLTFIPPQMAPLAPSVTATRRQSGRTPRANAGQLPMLPVSTPMTAELQLASDEISSVPDFVAKGRRQSSSARSARAPRPPPLRLQDVSLPEPQHGHAGETKAVQKFGARHRRHTEKAQGLLCAMDTGPSSARSHVDAPRRFAQAIYEVSRNRLWMDEVYDPTITPKPPLEPQMRPRRKWRLDESIWAPRKTSGNSRDYFETHECLRAMFDGDWRLAEMGNGLCKAIAKNGDMGNTWVDADGNGTHDSVDATRETLWEHHRVVYGAYDYYAALSEDRRDTDGELPVWHITFNQFLEFCRDCQITIDGGLIQTIWVQVNAVLDSPEGEKLDRFNHKRLMVRHEFLQSVVRLAIASFVGKGESSVESAVRRLCEQLRTYLPPEALQDSNHFRRTRCYLPLVDSELRKANASLHAVFSIYASSNRSIADNTQSSSMMSMGEFLYLLEHTGLIDAGQVSYFGAKMIFKWSRIRTSRGYGDTAEIRLRNLFFEDFLEAIVRLACIAALPSDAEVEASRLSDAGEFLMALREAGNDELDSFVLRRKVGWQGQPRQQVHRCVHHLISYLIRVIETSAGPLTVHDLRLTEDEVSSFEDRMRRGGTLGILQNGAALLDGVHAAASIVRTSLLLALRKVPIFTELSDDQIEALRDSMVEAQYTAGQFVFEQDEEGASFFVIIEGQAAAYREEAGRTVTLKEYTAGDYFGERALLHSETRYASIQATSKTLYTMCISRDAFESTMGCPLRTMVPDRYTIDKTSLVAAFQKVELFALLNDQQLQSLADAMHEKSYLQHEWVFLEGESGDSFYVIISGEATVMRSTGKRKSHKLADLRQWATFGERGLLRSQPRFAGVQASSETLKCLCVAKAEFEKAVGARLKDLIPDLNK